MSFNVENILVVGLGMIGSSIAFAAKSKGIKVNGIDLNENVVKKAIEKNIIDAGIKSLEEINTNDIDLIILAVPPKKTLELFETLDYLWNTSVTITDTSSVKNHINLKDVEYMDSSGISVLIESHQKATELGTKVTLKEISKSVLKVIMMAKLEQILNLD